MQRDVGRLAETVFDVVIIGAGIHGACIAWDAALRGLSVAVIDRGDFGHATSANSLKTVHGGLRYLQDADLRLVRSMIRERRFFARVAPHLVHPLPCVMPTYSKLLRSKPVMAAALILNDLVGFDRNRLADPDKHLPRGRVISRSHCLRLLPGLAGNDLTGGAIWYDYQIYNTERLTFAIVRSAAAAGAEVANYVEAVDLLTAGRRVIGVRARDMLTGDEIDVYAETVVNAAGARVNRVLDLVNGTRRKRTVHLSTAMNLVTRQIIPDYAAGIPSRYQIAHADGTVETRSRILFVAPWREYSIIGTDHAPYTGRPSDLRVSEQQIRLFLDEFNAAYPQAALRREDVYFVHSGFLPAQADGGAGQVELVRKGQVYDHAEDDGVVGLISVAGVKYTTARHVAEQAVDLIFRALERPAPACTTLNTPISGGEIDRFQQFRAEAIAKLASELPSRVARQLVYNHGSELGRVIRYVRQTPAGSRPLGDTTAVCVGEVRHAVHEEMAQTLSDVVFRRTELGSAGYPGDAPLKTCAAIMADELGWDRTRTDRELERVYDEFRTKGSVLIPTHSSAAGHNCTLPRGRPPVAPT